MLSHLINDEAVIVIVIGLRLKYRLNYYCHYGILLLVLLAGLAGKIYLIIKYISAT